ncbi:glycosyltransferase family 2 protein [Maribellus mangrovi]|uniref:glycosyltransferase family 2 protein n=1 Tax=Maribellus mangrovi TaxID=3133146 RepID=UPI0030EE75B5
MPEKIKPLVSVTVITYNSSKYILETLDSIKAQTYKNIELIISDDCSTDTTVNLCESWLNKNKTRFVNAYMVTTNVNTGIVGNKNRALEKCSGEWIKGIAGDDILLASGISDNVTFALQHEFKLIFSKFEYLFDDKYPLASKNKYNAEKNFSRFSSENQFCELLKYNFVPAATGFVQFDFLKNIGGYNPKYPMLEDYPLWLKATKNGYRLGFMDKVTVNYRIHDLSVSGNSNLPKVKNQKIINSRYYKSLRLFMKSELIPEQIKNKFYMQAYIKILFIMKSDLILRLGNKQNMPTTLVSYLFKLINPNTYFK